MHGPDDSDGGKLGAIDLDGVELRLNDNVKVGAADLVGVELGAGDGFEISIGIKLPDIDGKILTLGGVVLGTNDGGDDRLEDAVGLTPEGAGDGAGDSDGACEDGLSVGGSNGPGELIGPDDIIQAD
jgi:hypothetical protein